MKLLTCQGGADVALIRKKLLVPCEFAATDYLSEAVSQALARIRSQLNTGHWAFRRRHSSKYHPGHTGSSRTALMPCGRLGFRDLRVPSVLEGLIALDQ